MPRAYTADESARIRARLLALGRERFVDVGLKRVKVAELTRAVGIGTGSFYLFFPSKEALFFAIQEEEETAFKAMVEARLATLEEASPVETIEAFLRLQGEMLDRHPFLRRLVDPDTLASLLRRVDPEVLAQHQASDRRWLRGLGQRWIDRGILPADTDPEAIAQVSTALFLLATQRDVMGEAWPATLDRMARALARDLTG